MYTINTAQQRRCGRDNSSRNYKDYIDYDTDYIIPYRYIADKVNDNNGEYKNIITINHV